MIRAAQENDSKFIIDVLRAATGLGPRLEVDWMLLRQNPAMPYRFFIVDDNAVLQLCGGKAVLCGAVQNPAELEAFFEVEKTASIMSTGWTPAAWESNAMNVMVLAGTPPQISLPQGFEDDVSTTELMQVLESTEPFTPQQSRDAFYSDMCTRRNHGYASFCGVRQKGKLAAVAAVFSLTPAEAYIAGVETCPGARGQGLASALVAHLCAKYSARTVSLVCENSLLGFYKPLGFELSPAGAVQAFPAGK